MKVGYKRFSSVTTMQNDPTGGALVALVPAAAVSQWP